MALIRVYNKDTGNFDIYCNNIPNLENYYTKNEIDIMLENLVVDVDLSNYYTKLQIDYFLGMIGKAVAQPSTFDFTSIDIPAGIYSFHSGGTGSPFDDGVIISLPYRIGTGIRWGAQLAFEDGSCVAKMRFLNGSTSTWSEWFDFAFKSDIPEKAPSASVADNAIKWGGYEIEVGSGLPGGAGKITFNI